MTINQPHGAKTDEPPEWMSPRDVCEQFQILWRSFYHWRAIRLGPPSYKFGELIRVNFENYNEWTADHATAHYSGGGSVQNTGTA